MRDTSAKNAKTLSVGKATYLGMMIGLTAAAGCSFTGGPRARLGYLPTATFGVLFPDPDRLGRHSYGTDLFGEVGGIVYTCKGGHIDLHHIRGTADDARYLVREIRKTLAKNRKGFSFNLTGERSTHKIRFTYPANWDRQPDKDKIIDEIAFETAVYLAFNAMTWHEIQTWFGVHFALVEPEFNSAFSWEDTYSNLVGARLGVEAVKDTEHDFDEAMTVAIYRRLKELDVQPRETAKRASDSVRGQWYTGNFVPDMRMRNFDIGLDGTLAPTLVPGVADCNDEPLELVAPALETLNRYGFAMTYEIKPNVLEQGRIFKAAGSNRILPEKHYPVLIEHMKKEAIKRGYRYDE
jgi:hypothetical protein